MSRTKAKQAALALTLAGLAWGIIGATGAREIEEAHRWYALYFEGAKHGQAHTVTKEYDDGGAAVREVAFNSLFKLHGRTEYNYGSYRGYGEIKGAVNWDFSMTVGYDAIYRDGRLVKLDAKRVPSRGHTLKATGRMEGDTFVVNRTEGAVDETLRIEPGDYDLTADTAELEPLLATVTEEPVTKKVFLLGEAEIREQTFVRRKDGTTKDEDGQTKPCRVYRSADEERKTTYKTIDGRIVYVRYKDNDASSALISRLTTKKKAKSADGY